MKRGEVMENGMFGRKPEGSKQLPKADTLWLSRDEAQDVLEFLHYSADALDDRGNIVADAISRSRVVEALASCFVRKEFVKGAFLLKAFGNTNLVKVIEKGREKARNSGDIILVLDFLDDERFNAIRNRYKSISIFTLFDLRLTLDSNEKIIVIPGIGIMDLLNLFKDG